MNSEGIGAPLADGVPQPRHALLAANVLTAAVAGFALGAMASPASGALGALVGLGVGTVIGLGLEKQMQHHEAHDRELDDAIGITSGTIGTPDENKRPSQDVIEEAELEEARRRGELP